MNSLHELKKKVKRRLMKLTSSKQDYHLRRNMVIASGVEKKDTLQEIARKIKREAAKKNLNSKGVLKKGDWKPQEKAAGGKKE